MTSIMYAFIPLAYIALVFMTLAYVSLSFEFFYCQRLLQLLGQYRKFLLNRKQIFRIRQSNHRHTDLCMLFSVTFLRLFPSASWLFSHHFIFILTFFFLSVKVFLILARKTAEQKMSFLVTL